MANIVFGGLVAALITSSVVLVGVLLVGAYYHLKDFLRSGPVRVKVRWTVRRAKQFIDGEEK